MSRFEPSEIVELTFCAGHVRLNTMRAGRLHDALQNLTNAICEVENAVAEMKADRDPLASHIFVSRRQYRATNDTKSGKRREVSARLSYQGACELGFRGSLGEWERLMGGGDATR